VTHIPKQKSDPQGSGKHIKQYNVQ